MPKSKELSDVEEALLGAYELIYEDEPYGLQDVPHATSCWTPVEREKLARIRSVGAWLKRSVRGERT